MWKSIKNRSKFASSTPSTHILESPPIVLTLIYSLHIVTIMFDGVMITVPYLLYHDEISVGTTNTSGNLTCMVGSNTPIWRDVSVAPVYTSSPLQSETSGLMSRLSRTGAIIPNDDRYNGVWSCRDRDVNAFGFIGIYNRGEGKLTCTLNKCI